MMSTRDVNKQVERDEDKAAGLTPTAISYILENSTIMHLLERAGLRPTQIQLVTA